MQSSVRLRKARERREEVCEKDARETRERRERDARETRERCERDERKTARNVQERREEDVSVVLRV